MVFNHPIFSPIFKWYASLDRFIYLKVNNIVELSGPFENRTFKLDINVRYVMVMAAILFLPFEKLDQTFCPAKMDHFIQNKNVL
jgi:hypothetical protein